MFKVLAKEAPEVKVTNAAIAGGAGAGGDMKAVLATRMNAGNPPDSFQVHLGKELTDGYAKADKIPLARIGQPQDMAQAVLFLLGEDSSDVTGQDLRVDGGATLF